MKRFPSLLGVTLLMVGGFSVTVRAPEVVLTSGERFRGKVRLRRKTLEVYRVGSVVTIPPAVVKSVELTPTERAEYDRRRAALGVSANQYVTLAKWLAARCQHAEAAKLYESALRVNPDHPGARRALGYRGVRGEWVLNEVDRWKNRSDWLGPEGAEANFRLAELYVKRGKPKLAESRLRRALIADPTHVGALKLIYPITLKRPSKNRYRLPLEGLCRVEPAPHHRRYALSLIHI